MHAAFLESIDVDQWSNVEALLAEAQSGYLSVAAQVGITQADGSRLRIDLQSGADYSCFQDVRCVGGFVYIGYGDRVFVVEVDAKRLEAHSVDGYFGHLYTHKELETLPSAISAIAASASELLSFSQEGRLCWRATDLGVDGVVVHSIQNGTVRGSGEWDPPGGWEAFTISADTGEKNVA